ncbi:MAG: PqqD family protein [Methanomassiliicoccaceae archaeon]|nr:PqqD family protein [Methanomassiliicoccaceae archaeon]
MVQYREEKEGHISITPSDRTVTERKLLNRTSKEILDAADGENTVKDIVEVISNRYPSASKELIERDVTTILFHIWKNGIITWKKGGNPFMSDFMIELSPNEKVRLAFEEDTKELIEYYTTSNARNDYYSPLINISIKEPLFIRHSMFTLNHLFFVYEKDGKIESVVIISVDWISSVATIIGMQNVDDKFIEYFPKIAEVMKKFSAKKYNKIRIIIECEGHDEMRLMLRKSGFESTVVLKKEIEDRDLEMFDYDIFQRGNNVE